MGTSLRGLTGWSARHEELLRLGIAALFSVALLEAFLGRALSRAFPLIPRSPESTFVFESIGRAGVFLFDLGFLLVLLVLVMVLWSLRAGARRLPAATDAIALGTIVLVTLGLAAFGIRDLWLVIATAVLFLGVAFALLWVVARESRETWSAAFAALVAVAYFGSRYYAVASAAGQLVGFTGVPPAGLEGIRIAEAAAVLVPIPLFASIVLPLGKRGDFRLPIVMPSIVTALFTLAAVASPSITAAIAEAALGLRLYLPLPLYALGLWLAVAAFLILWREPATRARAVGMGLVMVAGIDLLLTYHLFLAVSGLLLWALRGEGREPVPATLARTALAPAPAKAADSGPAARS